MEPITITGVWLMRKGRENDPHATAEVHVEIDGQWRRVISEPLHGNFSHVVNVQGMQNALPSDFASGSASPSV